MLASTSSSARSASGLGLGCSSSGRSLTVGSRLQAGRRPAQASSQLGSSQPALLAACRAQPEEQQGGSETSGKTTDWDSAWSSFTKQMRSQVDTNPQRRRAPPRVVRPLNRGMPGGRTDPQDKIRRAERLLLDIWTNEDFLKVGVVGSLALFVVFALIIGPPPADDRCTAFWCGGLEF